MTQNFRKLVGLHDQNWTAEAVHFDMNEQGLTLAYPKWFIDLLVNQHRMGYAIQFNSALEKWFLRNPIGPDFELVDKESWVVQTCEGHCVVFGHTYSQSIERFYRDFVEGVDLS